MSFSISASILGGLVCHGIFKRFEPSHPGVHLIAFVLAPLALPFVSGTYPETSLRSSAILQSWLIYMGTLLLSITAYRLSPFHPLAGYPGPILCKLTKLWPAYISWHGKQHLYYQSLHRQHGDVIRIGPNELSIINPAAIGPLFGQTELPKGPIWEGRLPDLKAARPLIAIRDLSDHARRRRPWSRAFSVSALRHYESLVVRRVEQLQKCLSQQTGPVNLAAWMGYFAYDFMSDMAFGGGSEMMRDADNGGIWHLIDDVVPFLAVLGHVPWLGQYWIRQPFWGASTRRFRSLAVQCGIKRTSEGSTTKDIFHYLNNEDGYDATPRPFPEVISDASLAIVAGSDTTATTLSSIFCLILDKPAVFQRLRDEIDANFAIGDDVLKPAVHARMPYLNGVINEALRLLPPVPTLTQRANPQHAPAHTASPYIIPGGTSVITPHYVIQRDPRNFSHPDMFLPERWLEPNLRQKLEPDIFNETDFVHNTDAFIPFSYGPSNCAGKGLAYQEMRMVLCLLVRSFDMKLVTNPVHWMDSLEDYFLMRKGPLMVEVYPREPRTH